MCLLTHESLNTTNVAYNGVESVVRITSDMKVVVFQGRNMLPIDSFELAPHTEVVYQRLPDQHPSAFLTLTNGKNIFQLAANSYDLSMTYETIKVLLKKFEEPSCATSCKLGETHASDDTSQSPGLHSE